MKSEFISRNNVVTSFFANNNTSEFNQNKSNELLLDDNFEMQNVEMKNYFSNSRTYYNSTGNQINLEQVQSDRLDEKMSVIQEVSLQSSTLAISKPPSNSKRDNICNVDHNLSLNRQSLGHYSRREGEDDEDEPSL